MNLCVTHLNVEEDGHLLILKCIQCTEPMVLKSTWKPKS